ncbi:Soluble epoxide hydrolase [Achromobacter deleyi]|uniref:Soluble epoxide hydrolase n=1 Tax=Achromobacter deleyi TaxID=1353891 RepID=A0A6S7AEG7_9BURK|nr:alpha/beta hydrolase [Achromobacter deleyi]CAB3726119.1 Soluble epoxide hydrolase [Achromobacter deleyi]CAB3888467.1 Soluble epoxide hydrolase [Achromobacter deleyi]CAB3916044.1 Soluble epoxide hydrolase [Achromobacter deleyi]
MKNHFSHFKNQTVTLADGERIFVRSGGSGPAVVLIHGFGDTGDMWGPLAQNLAKTHLVIVPDLRGMGHSSKAASGYDKKSQAVDIRAVVTAFKQDKTAVVGHDIGTMVAYAYAASYPDKVDKLVVMDAPVPGIAPWDQIILWPALWHFNAGGPDFERLVAGRERIYLDRFWNEFAGTPSKIDEATRRHYAELYSQPGAMRAAFAQFNAIAQKDVADNIELSKTRLTMPVLAIGGEKSFGENMAIVMRNAATNVRGEVVPDAGHWLMEESPDATVALIGGFLAAAI